MIRLSGLKPILMMISVQIAYAGVTIFYKLAANQGMSLTVMIAYRFMFAVITIVPLAFIVERKSRPKLTWKIVFESFVIAFFGGSMAQNLYAKCLALTTATFAAALANLIPAATFILVLLFRIEKLGLKTMVGRVKVMGTVLCVGGAMLLTFYKGAQVKIWSTHFDLLHGSAHVAPPHPKPTNYILGLVLGLCCCLSSSFSLIFQAKMTKIYPCMYSSTALISLMGFLQATTYALCTERDWNQWKLGWNLRLLSVAYMGIVASGLMSAFVMWVVRMRGPLFASIFNPLMLVLVAIAGSLLLNESLHVGCVAGAGIIICGLYTMLWGNQKELEKSNRLIPASTELNEAARGGRGEEDDNDDERSKDTIPCSMMVVAVAPNFVAQSHEDAPVEEDDFEANRISKPN